jgi:hypothetical protein
MKEELSIVIVMFESYSILMLTFLIESSLIGLLYWITRTCHTNSCHDDGIVANDFRWLSKASFRVNDNEVTWKANDVILTSFKDDKQ